MELDLKAGKVTLRELTYGEMNDIMMECELHSGLIKKTRMLHMVGVIAAKGSRDEKWITELIGKDALAFREGILSLLGEGKDDIKKLRKPSGTLEGKSSLE